MKTSIKLSNPETEALREWALHDVKKSGLDEKDFELLEFECYTKYGVAGLRGFRAHQGYSIPGWDSKTGVKSGSLRIRYMPPLPLDREGRNVKYAQRAGSENEIYVPYPIYRERGIDVASALADANIKKMMAEGAFQYMVTACCMFWLATNRDRLRRLWAA